MMRDAEKHRAFWCKHAVGFSKADAMDFNKNCTSQEREFSPTIIFKKELKSHFKR